MVEGRGEYRGHEDRGRERYLDDWHTSDHAAPMLHAVGGKRPRPAAESRALGAV